MKKFSPACLLGGIFLQTSIALAAPSAAPQELKILSDRTESHLKPIFESFEKQTGVHVKALFLERGLIERLEANPTEADLVITKDADLLALAKTKKLLQAFNSRKITDMVAPEFIDTDKTYLVDAYRARVIFYSKARVKPEQLSTYADLSSPKWKGKLCVRSGYHDYNLSLFGQMEVEYGTEKTKTIVAGLHANLAREPKGNDREQAKAIFEGKCDVALMNTYYHPIMLSNPEQKPWAEATGVFFPDQANKGTFAMRSAAAIPAQNKNPALATSFMEYLVSAEAQNIMTNVTFQYPVNKKVQPHESSQKLGEGQASIKKGSFKINFVSLDKTAQNRESVVKILNEVNFDKLK